jgi:hypothetical protein
MFVDTHVDLVRPGLHRVLLRARHAPDRLFEHVKGPLH